MSIESAELPITQRGALLLMMQVGHALGAGCVVGEVVHEHLGDGYIVESHLFDDRTQRCCLCGFVPGEVGLQGGRFIQWRWNNSIQAVQRSGSS